MVAGWVCWQHRENTLQHQMKESAFGVGLCHPSFCSLCCLGALCCGAGWAQGLGLSVVLAMHGPAVGVQSALWDAVCLRTAAVCRLTCAVQKEAHGLPPYPKVFLHCSWDSGAFCLWWLLVLLSQCGFTTLLLALQGGGQHVANLPEHGFIIWVRWAPGSLLVAPGEVLAVGAVSQQLLCALWVLQLCSHAPALKLGCPRPLML